MEEVKAISGNSAVGPETFLQTDLTLSENAKTSTSTHISEGRQPQGWMRGAIISKWSFGQVYLGLDETTGQLMAVKQVELNPDATSQEKEKTKEALRILDNEVDIAQHLDHANIVSYLGRHRSSTTMSVFFKYVPSGSISSLMQTYGKLEHSLISSLTRQTLEGLVYLHSKGILHRDLRSNNLLLDHMGTVKISGFGASRRSDSISAIDDTDTMQGSGSIFWMAPEVVRTSGGEYSAKADVWSVGCVALEMFSQQRPWGRAEAVTAAYKLGVMNEVPPISEEVVSEITPEALKFLLECFAMYVRFS
jgi:serine/threonine protein kinase